MDWYCLPGGPCGGELEVPVTRRESHDSLVMGAKNADGNSGNMRALFLPSLFPFINQGPVNKERIIKVKC